VGDCAYYTLDQAVKILQVSEATIRRGIKKGEIPKAKFCGKVLIPAWFIKQGFEKGERIERIN
jgi:excisionase family DNA binding protein